MKVVQVNFAFDPALRSPEALLNAYHTLTGWSDAIAGAGVSAGVVQAFHRDACVRRRGTDYLFCGAHRLSEGMAAAVAAFEPDIVHVNGFDAPRLTWRLRRAIPSRVPFVMQHHAGGPPRRIGRRALSTWRCMAAADGFMFTSAAQADPWVHAGYISERSLVHEVMEASTCMIPMDREQARATTGVLGSPALLWVGRLDANKDPLTVLDGFERALQDIPDATLTMVFTADTLRPAIEARTRASQELQNRVRLIGQLPPNELPAWYSAADLFVLGSHEEGSGYAVIEACACGATPVVSDIPPFRAITGEGLIGRHWRVADSASCAAAIVDAARALGPQSRRAVLDHFSRRLCWDAVGRRARAIYEAVIANRQRRD